MAWVLVGVAVPALYVLSVPPLFELGTLGGPFYWRYPWGDYADPYIWLRERTPLEPILDAYDAWCARVLGS